MNPPPPLSPQTIARLIAVALLIFVLIVVGSQSTYIVDPGHRGVRVVLGKVSQFSLPEGFGFKAPFIARVVLVNVRQQSKKMRADCFSSDLQQITTELRVLYSIPESSAVSVFRDYLGDPFETLVAGRVHEALKEVTARHRAEEIVQNRERVKAETLESSRIKIGDILYIHDIVIEEIVLSRMLEQAIEQKMVQEQEVFRSGFRQRQIQTEAQTAIIAARGEARALELRGAAIRENPTFLKLQIVDRWNGTTPIVVGGQVGGAEMLLPIKPPEANIE
jgi:prohibitin 2